MEATELFGVDWLPKNYDLAEKKKMGMDFKTHIFS